MLRLGTFILLLHLGILLTACGGSGSVDGSNDTSTTETDSLNETATPQQKVDLSWTAPSTRADGSSLSLSELEGYRVYIGTTPDDLQLEEELVGVTSTQASVPVPAPGTYYLAVTAYDSDGLESSFSAVISIDAG